MKTKIFLALTLCFISANCFARSASRPVVVHKTVVVNHTSSGGGHFLTGMVLGHMLAQPAPVYAQPVAQPVSVQPTPNPVYVEQTPVEKADHISYTTLMLVLAAIGGCAVFFGLKAR